MYRISTYIPETHIEEVKEALFAVGAGRYRHYDSCSWQTLGTGQFRPLKGSNPFIGEEMVIDLVPEYKLEIVCDRPKIQEVIETLILTHPYEEPAYEIYEFMTLEDLKGDSKK